MAEEAENNEELVLTEEAGQEAAETPQEETGEEEEILTFGDEPAEVAETDNATIRHLRDRLKELGRENAELRKPKVETSEDPGPEPTLEQYEWDEEKHRQATIEWARKQVAHETRRVKTTEEQEAQIAATRARIEEEKRALGKPDVEEAFEVVQDSLTEQQQSILVNTVDAGNTAKLVYALRKNPVRLAELASITDPVKFIKEVTKLEASLKIVRRRAAPEPEEIERGSGQSSTPKVDKELERLEKEAERTKDRSKVIAYKRKLKATNE